MKFILTLLCSSFFFVMTSVSVPAGAQSTGQSAQPNPQQYMSHQMHQPPPDPNERYRISEQLIDEIRELYMLARKEAAGKTRQKFPADK